MANASNLRPDLKIFGVRRLDPGCLYIIKNADLFKVGMTTDPRRRLERDAKTWLPNLEVVGVKPFWNVRELERLLHSGLAQFWCAREWHRFPDDSYDWFFEEFQEFYDEDRDMNSVDFIYWINGSGLGELIMEQGHRHLSLRKWQREAASEYWP